MLIDWFTVMAQLVNFLILVWLLKRVLYKPIIKAVRTREQLVKDQVALADEKVLKSEALIAEWNEKNRVFEDDRELKLKQVKSEVEQVRASLLADAQKEYDKLSRKQKEALQEAEHQMHHEITQLIQTEVFNITRNTLQALASKELEKQMVQAFIGKLEGLDESEKVLLSHSVNVLDRAIYIRSVYEIEEQERTALKKAIHEVLSQEIQLVYEHKPELITGIELVTDGYRLSWNADEFINQIAIKTVLAEKN